MLNRLRSGIRSTILSGLIARVTVTDQGSGVFALHGSCSGGTAPKSYAWTLLNGSGVIDDDAAKSTTLTRIYYLSTSGT